MNEISEMIQEILEVTEWDKRMVGKYLAVSQHSVHAWVCSPGARVSKPQDANIRKLHAIVQNCVVQCGTENQSGDMPSKKCVRSRLNDCDELLQFRREITQPNIHDNFTLEEKVDVIRD